MKTIGFVISHKNNEMRRAVIPADLANVRDCSQLYLALIREFFEEEQK